MKRYILPICAVLLASCGTNGDKGNDTPVGMHINNIPDSLVKEVYSGTLPCDDCEGVVTSLELVHEPHAAEGSYNLKEIYKGKPEGKNIFTAKGQWTTLRGDAVNKDAVVIQLNDKDASRYFLNTNDSKLHQLDNRMMRLKDSNDVLVKQDTKGL